MRVIFVSSTDAQLINAMTLSVTKFKNDVVELFYRPSIEKRINHKEIKKYFSSIYILPVIDSSIYPKGIRGHLNGYFDVVTKWKTIIDTVEIDPRSYDVILIPGVSIAYYMVYYAIRKKNKSIDLKIYEEGINEYFNLGMKNYKKYLIHKLVFGSYFYNDCTELFVHVPELVDNKWKNIKLSKMEDPTCSTVLYNDIKIIFDYPTQFGFPKKGVCFIDQAFPDNQKYSIGNLKQQEIIEQIESWVGKDNIYIKLHPRSPKHKYGEKYNYLNIDSPFELIGFYENINDMLFVSLSSSTSINFKLVLNIEAKVIIAHSIVFKNGKENKNVTCLFKKIQSTYKKDFFRIPNNTEELELAIKDLFWCKVE